LADYFIREMAMALGDGDLLAAVDFYKCYRAYVRGKVETFQSLDARESTAKESSLRKAKNYFKLALSYAVAGSQPLVVVVMGRIASGKSTLARMLGRELEWDVFSSDVLRKTLARVPLDGREVSAEKKKQLYAQRMTERTYQALLTSAVRHVRKRHSVILDATYGRRSHRDQLRERLRRTGVSFCFIEAKASNRIIRQRLKNRTGKTAQASDARIEDFPKLSESYEPPKELPLLDFAAIETSKLRSEAITTNLLKALADLRALAGGSRASESRRVGTRSAAK
jgi:predicted kinase